MGFLSANRIGPMLNDMNVDVTFEGDNTVLMQQAAKGVLEEVAQTSQLAPGAHVDTQTVGGTLAALSALRIAMGKELAAAMRAANGSSQDRFDANLDLAVKLGWVHVAVQALSAFIDAVGDAPEPAKPLLQVACQLYAATVLEEQQVALVSNGVLPIKALAGLR